MACNCRVCNPPRIPTWEEPVKLTSRERILKQRKERYREAEETKIFVRENASRYAEQRAKTLAGRKVKIIDSLSDKGIKLLMDIEQLRLKPYDDQTGKEISSYEKGATIGYGYLIPRNEWNSYKNGINESEAKELFHSVLKPFEKSTFDIITIPVTQQQFDALVMLNYNIGYGQFKSSSVAAILTCGSSVIINNYRYRTSFDDAWKAFNKSQGHAMQGLNNRRQAEIDVYLDGVYEKW